MDWLSRCRGARMTLQALIVVAMAVVQQSPTTETRIPHFSDSERQAITAYWSEPGRYTAGPVADPKIGQWAVRLTPQASQWFWNYNRARGYTKTPPSQVPPAQNAEQENWENWINAKVARDRWVAGKQAEKQNFELNGQTPILADTLEPPDPGSAPAGLVKLVGKPPVFAECVQPRLHEVRFDEKYSLKVNDYPALSVRYAYLRNECGVMSAGQPMKTIAKTDVDKLFSDAGLTDTECKVMKAVSLLEGGFDSINTYDTGYVSVGFIQFACLKNGSGSLGSMLLAYKTASPSDFEGDFRRFGLDINAKGVLVAVNPTTGEEVEGADAASLIMSEPRLALVFQRAGQLSKPYRIAQIKTARTMFYPGNDVVSFSIGQKTVSTKVKDIFRTEAGLATLMDRKVNTGRLDPLPLILSRIAAEYRVKKVSDLTLYEYDITEAMKYRHDYLGEYALTQPDRHGKRNGRK